jgi:adenylosuccinate lyase
VIARYTNPAMGALWSEQRRFETWLAVELAATDTLVDAGIVPPDAARELRAKAAFDVARIEEIEKTTQHDVIAFTTAVAERVGPRGGCTSASPPRTSSTPPSRFRCATRRI